jgi:hypothetical protein
VAELQNELGGVASLPPPRIDPNAWNAERLNDYLREIDSRISSAKFGGAVTLSYTCLEGSLKAFVKKRLLSYSGPEELVSMSRAVRNHLKDSIAEYPDEALTMLNHVAHTVDRARNRFSESHFEGEAGRWLALFVRDLVNAEIRLLLHFF